ncbi:MAG: hypothetical protein GC136_02640 [Alphaproteobacteria bacterium]|nr:hypothetical protein [Alphaproteobacteria bacterium]
MIPATFNDQATAVQPSVDSDIANIETRLATLIAAAEAINTNLPQGVQIRIRPSSFIESSKEELVEIAAGTATLEEGDTLESLRAQCLADIAAISLSISIPSAGREDAASLDVRDLQLDNPVAAVAALVRTQIEKVGYVTRADKVVKATKIVDVAEMLGDIAKDPRALLHPQFLKEASLAAQAPFFASKGNDTFMDAYVQNVLGADASEYIVKAITQICGRKGSDGVRHAHVLAGHEEENVERIAEINAIADQAERERRLAALEERSSERRSDMAEIHARMRILIEGSARTLAAIEQEGTDVFNQAVRILEVATSLDGDPLNALEYPGVVGLDRNQTGPEQQAILDTVLALPNIVTQAAKIAEPRMQMPTQSV